MSEFDKYAGQYEQIHKKNLGRLAEDPSFFDEHKILELKKYLDQSRPGHGDLRLLDYGCSIGKSYAHIKQHLPLIHYQGIDPSAESIRIAGESCFKTFDGRTIPFADESFDIILVSCVVHHIPLHDRPAVFREMKRALKPKGVVFIVEHNPFNPLTQYIVKTCPFDEDAHLLGRRRLQSNLEAAGFSHDQSRYVIFLPQALRRRLSPGFEEALRWCPLGAQYWIAARA